MKTFEERFTAWTDGQLSGDKLAEFEKELDLHEGAAAERDGARKLGDLLRGHGAAPPLANGDFFNSQLIDRLYAETPTEPSSQGETEQASWWGLPKLVWIGAACLVASIVVLPFLKPNPTVETAGGNLPPTIEAKYLAEVLESRTGDPTISATAFHTADNNMTVVWLDGLDYIPASNEITPSSRAN